jgi:hypothetical protein
MTNFDFIEIPDNKDAEILADQYVEAGVLAA